jgi:RimJ/RimL family protein N-acetyltransferase
VTSISIEPWRDNDLPLLTRLMGDPEMMRYLGGPESNEKIASRLARYVTYQHPESRMFKILVDGHPAGSVGYWDKTWQDEDVYEVGWSVLPEFQGRGIAVRATELAIERARQDARHDRIHAFPAVENAPSNRLCEKLGFELLGEYDFEFPPGHWMKCNDWRLALTAHFRRARSELSKEEGSP